MTAVPARHPSRPLSVPAGITAFAKLLGLPKPNAVQWQRLGEELAVGDEPMDQLVEWMSSAGMKEMRALFNRALDEGIDSVPDAPEPLRRFFTKVERVPHWVDWDKIARGSAVMRSSGADGMYIARDVSLQGGYMFSGFNKTLLRTGALEKGSNQRFAETMQWAMDVIAPGGLVPLGVGYQSTVRVRLIHAFVRRHVAAMPDWREDEWGLPINQTDMAATLVGALIAPAVGALGMGLLHKPADLDAVAHLTRYVGWLMGVDDYWLPRSFRDAVRVLYHTSCALSVPDDSTKLLAMPMADDPMYWNYERLPSLRRRLARAQHLSLTAAFLGPHAMRTMGLPRFVLPWYPLVRIPLNVARTAAMHLPGGLERVASRGQREHAAFMKTIIAGDAKIGASAAHIGRAA
ncbi:oxygenase MpaB family protein [Hoyosella subflava]|uniref:ER-bound oxygenase mpaB/mpaB'/Rubber oxygenase catalytic domain-containing protein n=1 Tax=Hoyosella subflava (strain DSM 45089 / JCM 17490 / NBRC 109087 / DQS3-9A1) TaxID=443218 RepID=F6EJ17_HOYSD|nr:oxygenase MpaB family protein [Hoyosella subflava]AEF41249.1 hypothetical protein AS9A_2802 [Hoyosella subflava DQS3-9A1]